MPIERDPIILYPTRPRVFPCQQTTTPPPLSGSARASLKPFPGARSAVRATRPTTRAAFPRLELLDRALDSAATRRSLFGRDDPTNPFVSRQGCQMLPGRLRCRFRADSLAQIGWDFVHGSGFGLVLYHHALPLSRTAAPERRSGSPHHFAPAIVARLHRLLEWQWLMPTVRDLRIQSGNEGEPPTTVERKMLCADICELTEQ
jgi:hypothetical protein